MAKKVRLLWPLIDWNASRPRWTRFDLAIALTAPLVLLMGMPFPVTLSWAVNGSLSFIAAIATEVSTLAIRFRDGHGRRRALPADRRLDAGGTPGGDLKTGLAASPGTCAGPTAVPSRHTVKLPFRARAGCPG